MSLLAAISPTCPGSASLDRRSEDVFVEAIVIPQLEFCKIERKIFSADLMEAAHDAALQDRPEALDCVRVDSADNVLPLAVVNEFVWETTVEAAVVMIVICANQADFG